MRTDPGGGTHKRKQLACRDVLSPHHVLPGPEICSNYKQHQPMGSDSLVFTFP